MFRLYSDAANLCTAFGLFAGLASTLALLNGQMTAALALLLFGALADVFDGPLARISRHRPQGAAPFGQELDTLADMCHSVLAPALWVTIALGQDWIAILCGLGLTVAGATRLAYFTAVKSDRPGYFIGVPVTYVPLTMGLLEVATHLVPLPSRIWVAYTVCLIVVQTVRFHFPKFTGTKFWIFAALMTALTAFAGARAVGGGVA